MYTETDKAEWLNNRRLTTAEVIEKLPDELRESAFVVGAWVWIETMEKPEPELREKIKRLGFKFNFKRGVWQHPCGKFRPSAPYDPREKYGATPVAEANE